MVNPIVGLGWPRTLAGIGVALVPAGQRPGPVLLPWEDDRMGTSEPDLARTRLSSLA